jgi:prolyl oligopeptidase
VPGREYLDKTRVRRVLFHRLGTEQAEDELVFAAPEEPEWLPDATVTDDGRFLIVSISRGTAPESQLWVLDLADTAEPATGLRPLVPDFGSIVEAVATVGSTFYLLTDHEAERRRIVAVDFDRPDRDHWREVVPESADTLRDAHWFGGRLVCHYLHDAHSVVRVHELDGTHVRDIPLPGIASLEGIDGRHDRDLVHLLATSFTESGSLWLHDLGSGQTALVRPSGCRIDPAAYVTEQVSVTSADGTRIPVFVTRRRDVTPTGDVPALLYGYGGFNIPLTPSFSVTWAVWLERGGLLAVANLRGGGEYGRAWHDAGRLARKQNVFDDFAACARWLSESGWSRPERIAVNGRSNGGLLVGASLTQHPELFGAAVPEVGVLDMLRFHTFTIGWAWTSDYGDPDEPEPYSWVRAYSPLHNVRPGVAYPPTLVLTGDHDDRVVPGHSFKFTAALQAAQGGAAPVLVRVETETGHGVGKPTRKAIAERADVLAFLDQALTLG